MEMKAGKFNIDDYLEKLYEETEEKENSQEQASQNKSDFMDGGSDVVNVDGIIIPDTNKKSYDWLKKEYQKGKTEVKVEISGQGASFKPGYELQTDLDSVKDFKPGMFGEVKTADTEKNTKDTAEKKTNLDPKKDQSSFTKTEGEAKKEDTKEEKPETSDKKEDIKDKEETTKEEKPKEKKEEEPEVKKIDLKTKKK